MKALPTYFSKINLWIKNGVIYRINQGNYSDACIVELTTENCPYITVNNEKRYFVNYIEVGDTYDSEFKKTIHKSTGKEESKEFKDYFKEECINVLSKYIVNNNISFDDVEKTIKRDRPIPLFMLEGYSDEEVSGTDKINLTEKYFNDIKKDQVKALVKEEGEKTIKKYGYTGTVEVNI